MLQTVPAPPNNGFTPILTVRFGCLAMAPAPPKTAPTLPNNDFTQSWLTCLVASSWRQNLLQRQYPRFGGFKRASAPPNNDFTPFQAGTLVQSWRQHLPATTLRQSWPTGFGCCKMAPAPPNNDYTPILADRCGCFQKAPAPPHDDFTRNPGWQVWYGLVVSTWHQHLPATTSPQSCLIGLLVSKQRQHLPTTT